MNRLESLTFTRISACFTLSSLSGSDTASAVVSLGELDDMIDDFYAEYKELISPEEYNGAKKYPETFIPLIDRVHLHYAKIESDGK
jgi:hypothetical protein